MNEHLIWLIETFFLLRDCEMSLATLSMLLAKIVVENSSQAYDFIALVRIDFSFLARQPPLSDVRLSTFFSNISINILRGLPDFAAVTSFHQLLARTVSISRVLASHGHASLLKSIHSNSSGGRDDLSWNWSKLI